MSEHDCGDFLWKADPPLSFGYIQCSCRKWYRRGQLEFWSMLLSCLWGGVRPRRSGGYWYRASGPGARP